MQIDEKQIYKDKFKIIDNYLKLFQAGKLKEFKLIKNVIFEKINQIKEYTMQYPARVFYGDASDDDRDPRNLLKKWQDDRPVIFHLYIPFCTNHCSYCNYVTYKINNREKFQEYLDYYKKEILMYRDLIARNKVSHVFISGGTPTLLPDDQFEDILQFVKETLGPHLVKPFGEIDYCCEASPASLTDSKIEILKKYKITILALGIQTLDEKVLGEVSRYQTRKEVLDLIPKIKDDFNLNFHLLSSLPGSSNEILKNDIDSLVKFRPEQIGMYNLFISSFTELGKDNYYVPYKKLKENYQFAHKILTDHGYIHKEFDKYNPQEAGMTDYMDYFFKDGLRVGSGIGDPSYSGNYWYVNTSDYNEYKNYLDHDLIPMEKIYKLQPEDLKIKYLILGLRGIILDKNDYKNRFNESVEEKFKLELDALEYLGYLTNTEDKIELTKTGIRDYEIIMQFFMRL